ncbi:PREDICTED: uncharacterized protein LOC109179034 [Ipomoea nil]|uniref:uncharacterized protein LOC109179034 n=1 Tax=Ipomoea nil TaxID=35883 RepID=UPI0009010A44|nr:PREDICTED: uncharacterized protein LOC109179034 [Ipomoea nil]
MDATPLIDIGELDFDEEYLCDDSPLDNFPPIPFSVGSSTPGPQQKRKKKRKASYSALDKSLILSIRPQLGGRDWDDISGLLSPDVLTLPPDPRGNITEPPIDKYFGVHLLSLQVGLRFPLNRFVVEFMNHYEIAPGQLVPNGHQVIAGFLALCKDKGIEPTLDLFQAFFIVGRASQEGKGFVQISSRPHFKLFEDRPTYNKDWKPKYFFVTLVGCPSPFRFSWGSHLRCPPTLDMSPSLRRDVDDLLGDGLLSIADYTAEWKLAGLGFVRARPAVLSPTGTMSSSSRTNRYLSRPDPPPKKSKVEKGKRSQAEATEVMPPPPTRTPTPSKIARTPSKIVERTPTPTKVTERVRTPASAKVDEGVTGPPPTRTPTAVTFSPQPPEVQGDTSNESSSRVRTNLIRLGMDVPPGASLINKSLDAVEYAARIAPPADVEHLVAMDVNMLQERYLRHSFEALLEGQIIHDQRGRVMDSLIEDVKIRDADNKSLKDLLSIREGALSKMEGELGALRKEHQALLARAEAISKMEGELEALRKEHEAAKLAIVKEREDHERTRAGHADALGRAVEVYKDSAEFKEDVMRYMTTPEAIQEFLKTGAGQEAVEAEAHVAFSIGRYTKQQELFSMLKEKVPNFDPVSLGLPIIEKNPDPDAEDESTHDVTGAREDSLDEFHGIDTSNVANVPLDHIMIEEFSDHE